MPLLTDGDITRGWIRERKLLTLLFPKLEAPDAIRNFLEKVSKATGLPKDEIIKSKPFRNWLKKFYGTDDINILRRIYRGV
ncbi:MAG TPA: hypothetical protein ENF41_02335 [Candidatus Bathyarchaeota archaeon]|nr:hypothetical protein [Candidatus Bathyarchaeota archaeon]